MVKVLPIHDNDRITVINGTVTIIHSDKTKVNNTTKYGTYSYCEKCDRYEGAYTLVPIGPGCRACNSRLIPKTYLEVKNYLLSDSTVNATIVTSNLNASSIGDYISSLEIKVKNLDKEISEKSKHIVPVYLLCTWIKLMCKQYVEDTKYDDNLIELYETPKVSHA